MRENKTLIRIYIGVLLSFFANKFVVRPLVLENDYAAPFKIFVLSYPNFCEAVVGSLLLANIGLVMVVRNAALRTQLTLARIYPLAVLVTGIYVILQEFKIHNLGGRNTYDPYDVLFSIAGLVISYGILLVVKPTQEG